MVAVHQNILRTIHKAKPPNSFVYGLRWLRSYLLALPQRRKDIILRLRISSLKSSGLTYPGELSANNTAINSYFYLLFKEQKPYCNFLSVQR